MNQEILINEIISSENFRKVLPNLNNIEINKDLYIYSEKDIIKIIRQFEITIQLLMQILWFSNNNELKLLTYNKINKFVVINSRLIFNYKIPYYDIFLDDFKFNNANIQTLELYTHEFKKNQDFKNTFRTFNQLSIYQSIKLEFIGEIFKQAFIKDNYDSKFDLLYNMAPILEKEWIIIKDYFKINILNKKVKILDKKIKKFSILDDHLLLLGIKLFGSKNKEKIRIFFIPNKELIEIKNRIFNTLKPNRLDNIFKLWKINSIWDLNFYEKINFEKGLIWFSSNNLNLIQKWFLPDRSLKFINLYYKNNKKLKELQAKANYNLNVYYDINLYKFNIVINSYNNSFLNIKIIREFYKKLKEKNFIKFEPEISSSDSNLNDENIKPINNIQPKTNFNNYSNNNYYNENINPNITNNEYEFIDNNNTNNLDNRYLNQSNNIFKSFDNTLGLYNSIENQQFIERNYINLGKSLEMENSFDNKENYS